MTTSQSHRQRCTPQTGRHPGRFASIPVVGAATDPRDRNKLILGQNPPLSVPTMNSVTMFEFLAIDIAGPIPTGACVSPPLISASLVEVNSSFRRDAALPDCTRELTCPCNFPSAARNKSAANTGKFALAVNLERKTQRTAAQRSLIVVASWVPPWLARARSSTSDLFLVAPFSTVLTFALRLPIWVAAPPLPSKMLRVY